MQQLSFPGARESEAFSYICLKRSVERSCRIFLVLQCRHHSSAWNTPFENLKQASENYDRSEYTYILKDNSNNRYPKIAFLHRVQGSEEVAAERISTYQGHDARNQDGRYLMEKAVLASA